jgi:hypothetical protein
MGRGNTGALLSPVLQGQKAIINQRHGILLRITAVHSEDPALLMKLIFILKKRSML